MSIGKKIWKIAVAALLLAPLFAGSLNASAATPGNADVTVHKRIFKDNMPANKANTGLEMPNFGGDPLAGAGFTVYDVTSQYHTALVGSTQTAAMNTVIAAYNANPGGYTAFRAEQLTTGAAGTTVFENLPLISGGKDAAYLFVETRTPATPTIVEKAASFILAMPIYTAMGSEGTLNTNIHVYPKNLTADNKKELTNSNIFGEVTINGEQYPNVQIGDTLNYRLTVQIPSNIDKVTTFVIKDTPGAGMAIKDPANLVVTGLTLTTDYTFSVDETTNVLTINLVPGSANVKALAGRSLVITYDMVLTRDAVPDTVIENNASITVDGDTTVTTTPPGVVTGGKQFIKKDKHTDKGLAGAKFKVKKGDQWAQFTVNTKDEYALTGWGTEAVATEVTAGSDGVFKIIGLTAGEYELKETVPPNGYVPLAENVAFTVAVPGYGSTDALRQTVNNVPKGLLPSTGGTGIYAFLIIGSMMMAGAYFWFKRSKEHVEV